MKYYLNGSCEIIQNEKFGLCDYEQVRDVIIVAESEGLLFNGVPDEYCNSSEASMEHELKASLNCQGTGVKLLKI